MRGLHGNDGDWLDVGAGSRGDRDVSKGIGEGLASGRVRPQEKRYAVTLFSCCPIVNLLSFAIVYFFESRLFNGLRAIQIRKSGSNTAPH
jgi:hypothetical protein